MYAKTEEDKYKYIFCYEDGNKVRSVRMMRKGLWGKIEFISVGNEELTQGIL